jgi:hypothetical protein
MDGHARHDHRRLRRHAHVSDGASPCNDATHDTLKRN